MDRIVITGDVKNVSLVKEEIYSIFLKAQSDRDRTESISKLTHYQEKVIINSLNITA